MKPVSLWVTLGMSLFLVLSTEAGGIRDVDFATEVEVRPRTQPPGSTFIQTDPGSVSAGSQRQVQGNTQTSIELVQIKLLRQGRVLQSLASQTGPEPDTAGWKSRDLMDLDGD